METIGKVGHVRYVNDSKATNADAARQALKSYDNIYWIAGGVAKDGGIEPLDPFFDKIKKAYLIGEAGPQFMKTLSKKRLYYYCLRPVRVLISSRTLKSGARLFVLKRKKL